MIKNRTFELIKGVVNWTNYDSLELQRKTVEDGNKFLSTVAVLNTGRGHFLYNTIGKDKSLDERLLVVNVDDYPLPVTWNIPTKTILINTSPFGTDKVNTKKIGSSNLYALLTYGFVVDRYLRDKAKFSDSDYELTFLFFLSLIVRLLARKFGLLASKDLRVFHLLKFILGCYVCVSFFGVTDLRKICHISKTEYNDQTEAIYRKYDFKSIFQFVQALNDEKVFSGLDKYYFASLCLKFFGINFLPSFEDPIRFYASLATVSCPNSNLIRGFIPKYNIPVYKRIIDRVKFELQR